MQINANIPMQGRVPQISLDPFTNAMSSMQNYRIKKNAFDQQLKQQEQNETVKKIMGSSVKMMPDGSKAIDKNSFLTGLYDNNMAKEAMVFQQKFAKEDAEKRESFLNNQGMLLKAKGDIFKQHEPYLRAISDPKERAGLLKDAYKQWKMDDKLLPTSIDDAMLESMKQSHQFATTKYQLRPSKEGYYEGYNPETNQFEEALDAEGNRVEVPETYIYREGEGGGLSAFSTKRPPGTAPTPIAGFKGKGAQKLKYDTLIAELGITKANMAITKAEKLAKGGGQFKTTQYEGAGFGIRMKEVESVLTDLAGTSFDPTTFTNWVMKEWVPGGLRSGPLKMYVQAQKSFINATLRRESGAAIAQSEFDNAQEQYFPEINDPPELLAQKKANRQVQQAMMMAEAGGAWGETLSALEKIRIGGKEINVKPLGGQQTQPKIPLKVPDIGEMSEEELDAEIRFLEGK